MTDSPTPKRRISASMSRIDEDLASESWITSARDSLNANEGAFDDDLIISPSSFKILNKFQLERHESHSALDEEEYNGPFVTSRFESHTTSKGSASILSFQGSSGPSLQSSKTTQSQSDVSLTASELAQFGGIFDSLEIDYTKQSDFRKDSGLLGTSKK